VKARLLKIPFKVQYEIHDRKKFQTEGHTIPALREEDAEGNPTRKERPWGDEVHALTLIGPDGEPAKLEGQSVCRVLSDSLADAERMFKRVLVRTFWSNLQALRNISFQAQQLEQSVRERTNLKNWMLSNGHRDAVEDIVNPGTYRVTSESGSRVVRAGELAEALASGEKQDIQKVEGA